jgi:hypothetical protein
MGVWSRDAAIAKQLADNPPLCDTSSESAIAACDALWENEPPQPGVKALLENACSIALRAKVGARGGFPGLAEIFVTDRLGRNACLSGKTSDYFQGDEAWWKAAQRNTAGLTYEYDSSTTKSSASLHVPVLDDDQRFRGAMKAVFDLDRIGHRIADSPPAPGAP